jgi:ParB-like chromosome segregation protein Spo0J
LSAQAKQQQKVAIASLKLDGTPRLDGQKQAHVRLLAETDDVLPPILVHRGSMRVIDGAHRVRAAQMKGKEEITAIFFEGSEEDAFLTAVARNIAHGLPLTLADRRAATERIVRSHPELSDRSIARTTGLSDKTVAVIRQTLPDVVSPSARTGRDGRARPLDGSSGRRIAAELITAAPDLPLRKVAELSGVSLGTARDVRERVKTGADAVPQGNGRQAVDGHGAASTLGREPFRSMAEEPDPNAILDGLRRDPSLRYSERGRHLLRLLSQRTVTRSELHGGVEGIPHCSIAVSKFAHACAKVWLEFARELDRRSSTY